MPCSMQCRYITAESILPTSCNRTAVHSASPEDGCHGQTAVVSRKQYSCVQSKYEYKRRSIPETDTRPGCRLGTGKLSHDSCLPYIARQQRGHHVNKACLLPVVDAGLSRLLCGAPLKQWTGWEQSVTGCGSKAKSPTNYLRRRWFS